MREKFHTLDDFQNLIPKTLMQTLEIQFSELGEDFLCAKMPVVQKVFQPMGFLHGGATAALIETVGGAASYLFIDFQTKIAKGINLSISHVRSVREGWIYARANALHCGRATHIWQVQVIDMQDRLVSTAKVTNMILDR